MIRGRSRTHLGGVMIPLVLILLAALVIFTSFAVDYGRVQLAKAELQTAADAAARYAASGIADGTTDAKGIDAANDNIVDGRPLVLSSADIDLGNWDSSTRTFREGGSPSNAVRVTASRTHAKGNAVPLIFGEIVGMSAYEIAASAIALRTRDDYGIVSLDKLTLSGGGAQVDSYDSYAGTYAATRSANAKVASNNAIELNGGAFIHGDANPGPGYQTTPASAVSGSTTPLNESLVYPNVSAGAAASSHNNAAFGPYINSSRDVSISSDHHVTVPAGTYFLNSLSVSGQATLTFTGPAIVYVTGAVSLSGGTNVHGDKPSNLRLRVIGSGGVSISGYSNLYAEVYAPRSNVTISGQGGFFGTVVGRYLTISGQGGVHHDTSLASTSKIVLVR